MIRSTRRNSRLIANYSRVIIYMKNYSIRSVILSKYTAKNEMQNFDIIFGCIIQMTEMSNLFISHVFFACKWQWIWFCIIFSCVLLISIIVWFLFQLKKKTLVSFKDFIIFEKLTRAWFFQIVLESIYNY